MSDPVRAATLLHVCTQITANLGILLAPFLPRTAAKLADAFGVGGLKWADARPDVLAPGAALGALPILFAKVEADWADAMRARLDHPVESAIEPVKDVCTFEDFTKLDLRVGVVTGCTWCTTWFPNPRTSDRKPSIDLSEDRYRGHI